MSASLSQVRKDSSRPKPRVLVIAGSDSSGGAGLEADQRVLALHNCYALTTTTALTAQSTTGVSSIHSIPSQFVLQCLQTIWTDITPCTPIRVVKIGMLSNTSTIETVAKFLAQKRAEKNFDFRIVLDPVMKATTGARLLDDQRDALYVLRSELLPLASIVTPNLPEALLLAGETTEPKTVEGLVALAKALLDLCASEAWVLVKGGHFGTGGERDGNSSDLGAKGHKEDREIVDVLVHRAAEVEVKLIRKAYIPSRNTHGTGCSLASIAANVAHGMAMEQAVEKACAYVQGGIKSAAEWELGKGSGPIDHWYDGG